MGYACNAENALKPWTMVNRDQFLKGGAAVSRVQREKGGGLEDRGSLFKCFTALTEKADPVMALTLEYLLGVPVIGRAKVRIHIQ